MKMNIMHEDADDYNAYSYEAEYYAQPYMKMLMITMNILHIITV